MIGKGAIPISDQHTKRADLNIKATTTLDVVEVILAIAIEIGPGNLRHQVLLFTGLRFLTKAAGNFLRQDAACPIAEPHIHCIHRGVAGGGDVRIAIVIEIPHGNGVCIRCAGDVSMSLESSIPIADQDGDVVCGIGSAVHHDQVHLAVFVPVDRRQTDGRRSCGKLKWGPESAVTIIEQNRDVIGAAVNRCQVRNVVAIEVSHNEPRWSSARGISLSAETLSKNNNWQEEESCCDKDGFHRSLPGEKCFPSGMYYLVNKVAAVQAAFVKSSP